ncbi:M64 family metallopeptidase, partial [Myxococcota bacterium]|nr:M64 family metallopeptidase [Myxococcota bacterium]
DGIGPVGMFEGGAGYETGIWRPTEDSKMGNGGLSGDARAYNAVVREAIVFAILERVSLFDSALAHDQVLTNPPALYAAAANADVTTLEWLVDGVVVAEQTENTFGFTAWAQANGVALGAHEVTLRATVERRFRFPNASGQNPSPLADFVRTEHPRLAESITWQVVLE